ncbi:acetyltransferase [Legionella nautarum]|uniref:Acetyltransferase n=1 Tax=Legionella nautarum TaxID=45070 RepID=A0A0W0X3V2_9GAMM|nr:acetyltransferase [Legionella nautarum]
MEIISTNTALGNYRSRRVMEKIGLTRQEKDDFDNPRLTLDHPLSKHVLYRLTQIQWRARQKENR